MADQPPQLPERFRIDEEIGRGGMAVVYRAHDRHLDRFVAIKVLSSSLSHAMGAERFEREIALMAKLVHPGIVALFDSGESNGRLFYVMPFVAGENLRTRLERERRMAVEEATAFAADVAEALAYAHGAGIVHRDVKPENIFTVGGRAVLADFGIAHIAGESPEGDRSLTSAGMVLGTVAYMSPEQAMGDAALDGRCDLYSLGCVLYELLTGTPPFTAGTPSGVLAKHITEPPKPPRDLNAGIPPAISDLIMALLAKEPGQRPPAAGDVARALRAVRFDGPVTPPATQPSEADRLTADALDAIARSVSAGAGARGYLEQAEAFLNRALKLEPQHARALVALGAWYFTQARRGWMDPTEAQTRGRALVLDAMAADPAEGEVYNSLAKIALYYDDDSHAARRHIDRAVTLEPKSGDARRFQAVVYKVLGRTDEAIRIAREATGLAPDMALYWNGLGDVLLAAGRNAEAVDALKRAIALQPGYVPAMERLEVAHDRLGEQAVAADLRTARLRVEGRTARAEALAREIEALGPAEARRRDLRRELDELLERAEREDPFAAPYQTRIPADQIIAGYAALGEWGHAMDWVERSFQQRPVRLRRVLTEPLYDRRGLAADPRYARLLRIAVLEDLL